MSIVDSSLRPRWSAVLAHRVLPTLVTVVCLSLTAYAQSPWERAASNLETTFTGPLARSLALVAIARPV